MTDLTSSALTLYYSYRASRKYALRVIFYRRSACNRTEESASHYIKSETMENYNNSPSSTTIHVQRAVNRQPGFRAKDSWADTKEQNKTTQNKKKTHQNTKTQKIMLIKNIIILNESDRFHWIEIDVSWCPEGHEIISDWFLFNLEKLNFSWKFLFKKNPQN